MADPVQNKLSELLRQAQAAHHDFETMELEGSRDEQWPDWYAQYLLVNGLAGMLGRQPDNDGLAAMLEQYSREHKTAGSQQDWAEFTAQRLLEAHLIA
jgi:hypothetical protein